jgi:hypothetical protein
VALQPRAAGSINPIIIRLFCLLGKMGWPGSAIQKNLNVLNILDSGSAIQKNLKVLLLLIMA